MRGKSAIVVTLALKSTGVAGAHKLFFVAVAVAVSASDTVPERCNNDNALLLSSNVLRNLREGPNVLEVVLPTAERAARIGSNFAAAYGRRLARFCRDVAGQGISVCRDLVFYTMPAYDAWHGMACNIGVRRPFVIEGGNRSRNRSYSCRTIAHQYHSSHIHCTESWYMYPHSPPWHSCRFKLRYFCAY